MTKCYKSEMYRCVDCPNFREDWLSWLNFFSFKPSGICTEANVKIYDGNEKIPVMSCPLESVR